MEKVKYCHQNHLIRRLKVPNTPHLSSEDEMRIQKAIEAYPKPITKSYEDVLKDICKDLNIKLPSVK